MTATALSSRRTPWLDPASFAEKLLIAPRNEIFPLERLRAELDAIAEQYETAADKRMAATPALRAALDAGREKIEAAFQNEIRSGARVARSIAALMDDLVALTHDFVTRRLFPISNPTKGEQLAVIAVGGYGRGEMAPYSDVDLLFLTPYRRTSWAESVVEATLYLLWDLRLKVGHATRTVAECMRLAGSDMTIRTALLEKRFLCGDRAVFDTLDEKLWSELFDRTGSDFLNAKLEERDKRHERTGGSRYLLEPNVKESKGGLRDLQTLYWIAKYLYRADTPEELVDKGVFTKREVARFRQAEAHLWTVRCGLHYLARRAQEKLTFDHQVDLASRFGYRETPAQRAVERFMTRYFVSAKQVGDITRIFCSALEQQHKKSPPLLGGVARFLTNGGGAPLAGHEDWLERRDGRLVITDADRLLGDPVNILRVFDVAIRRDVLIHPATMRLLDRHRRMVDDVLKTRPEAGRIFVELIAASRDPVRALRRMSETGVIDRLIPEFGRVTGLMQFNMYHHYTVEEHTIQAIHALRRIMAGELADEHPTETRLAATIEAPRVLTVALLFHDIGKGLPEDHSIAGERIAREMCPLLSLSSAETDQVAWLVRHHLVMSDVAQKRDIADPATVRDFARFVQSPERLKLLYLLTSCDIRAVGPGVWNGWKGQLLRQLYTETRAALVDDEDELSRAGRIEAARQALREQLSKKPSDWTEAHIARFYPAYWLGLDVETHALHARMVAKAKDEPLTMRVRQDVERSAAAVAFFTTGHPGIFARMAGALALAGASVVEARAYTTRDGMAVNTFWVQDQDGAPYDEPARLKRLKKQVERTLKGEVVARDALRERRKLPARERSFHVPPRVLLDNNASETFTVIEVNGRDRVGLLHDLARALTGENVNIFSAIIATYGEHAVDVFYVRDVFGMKIASPAKRAKIEQTLLTALERPDQMTAGA